MRRALGAMLAASTALAGGVGACGSDPAACPAPAAAPDAAQEVAAPIMDAAAGDAPMQAASGLDVRPANATCRAPQRPSVGGTLTVVQVLNNVIFQAAPMVMLQLPGDKTRWFAGLRDGRIVTFPSTNPSAPTAPTVVADLSQVSLMPVNQNGEGGLLGMALHPKFAQNGQMFVSWTTSGTGPSLMRSLVSRITTTNGGASWAQHLTVLGPFDQPDVNHKGGTAKFGSDGFLYLSFGDGGPGDGQALDNLLAKILRIDVDNPPAGQTYGIPSGNPFKNGGGEPATFARGFRNPFRFSFDRATGDLWAGDVGLSSWEEVDRVKVGGNYGWPCREGMHDYQPATCLPTDTLVEPVYEYGHNGSTAAITGGVVYRGSAIPELVGAYVFGDAFTDQVLTLGFDPTTGAAKATVVDAPSGPRIIEFAEDNDGEIYGLDLYGRIFTIARAQPAPPSTFPDRLSKTGCVDPADPNRPAPALVPYDVNAPFWSDGADKERFLALPDGKTIAVGADGHFELPIGSVLLQTFSNGGKRIETRLSVRHDDGDWAGYSYEWNDAQSDAVLLPSSQTKVIGAQAWRFPSRAECVGCHTGAAGHTLGLELGQLNRDFLYPSTGRVSNQLETLEHIGILAAPLATPVAQIVAYPQPTGLGPLDARARAYLHTNCSHCHRRAGPGGDLDLRFATSFADTKSCGVSPRSGDVGTKGAKVLTPGSPALSLLSLRPHALGAARMPPTASNVVDSAGLTVIDDWIQSVVACP